LKGITFSLYTHFHWTFYYTKI